MSYLIGGAVVLAMLVGLLLIPFGVPGLWIMVVLALALVLVGSLSWKLGLTAVVAAAVAELAELLVLRRLGSRFGGSSRAFWGAVAGGTAGLFVGLPVPLVGPLLTVFLGTFAGAALVTWIETRSPGRSARVGWGVVLARTIAVALKVAVGVALLAAVTFALLL